MSMRDEAGAAAERFRHEKAEREKAEYERRQQELDNGMCSHSEWIKFVERFAQEFVGAAREAGLHPIHKPAGLRIKGWRVDVPTLRSQDDVGNHYWLTETIAVPLRGKPSRYAHGGLVPLKRPLEIGRGRAFAGPDDVRDAFVSALGRYLAA
ncbi:hypothetical protein [Nocardioides sp.]|uniref:hypothetical protein n=1 Tax=Nocardioides sp. TaxID=35761 RepID=UPI0039E38AE5